MGLADSKLKVALAKKWTTTDNQEFNTEREAILAQYQLDLLEGLDVLIGEIYDPLDPPSAEDLVSAIMLRQARFRELFDLGQAR